MLCLLQCELALTFWTLVVLQGSTAAQSHNKPTHRCHVTYQHLCPAVGEVGGSGGKRRECKCTECKRKCEAFPWCALFNDGTDDKTKKRKSNTVYCEKKEKEKTSMKLSSFLILLPPRKEKNATCVISDRPTCCALTHFFDATQTTQPHPESYRDGVCTHTFLRTLYSLHLPADDEL